MQKSSSCHSKALFTKEEDEKLIAAVKEFGSNDWKFISQIIGTRNCRQCRERWLKYLSPELNNSPWTESEDQLLLEKYKLIGPKWALVAKCFKKRTDVNVKSRFQLLTRRLNRENKMNFLMNILNKINKHPQSSSISTTAPNSAPMTAMGMGSNGSSSIGMLMMPIQCTSSPITEDYSNINENDSSTPTSPSQIGNNGISSFSIINDICCPAFQKKISPVSVNVFNNNNNITSVNNNNKKVIKVRHLNVNQQKLQNNSETENRITVSPPPPLPQSFLQYQNTFNGVMQYLKPVYQPLPLLLTEAGLNI